MSYTYLPSGDWNTVKSRKLCHAPTLNAAAGDQKAEFEEGNFKFYLFLKNKNKYNIR